MCPSHLSEPGSCYETVAVLSLSSSLSLPCGGNHSGSRGVRDPRRQPSGGRPSAPPGFFATQGNLNYNYFTKQISSEMDNPSAAQQISCLIWNLGFTIVFTRVQSTFSHIIYLLCILILPSHLRPRGIFLPGLPTTTLNAFFISTMPGTCPFYLILPDKITRIIFREQSSVRRPR